MTWQKVLGQVLEAGFTVSMSYWDSLKTRTLYSIQQKVMKARKQMKQTLRILKRWSHRTTTLTYQTSETAPKILPTMVSLLIKGIKTRKFFPLSLNHWGDFLVNRLKSGIKPVLRLLRSCTSSLNIVHTFLYQCSGALSHHVNWVAFLKQLV